MGGSHDGSSRPSVAEHGLDGYTSEAVGGFGAGYDQQVAHGDAPSSPGVEEVLRHTLAKAHVDAAELVVHCVAGRATLTGTVRSVAEKERLGALASAVDGVIHVHNELQVRAS